MLASLYSTKHFVFLQNFMFTDCHNFFRISTFNYKHMNEINNLNVARYKYLANDLTINYINSDTCYILLEVNEY